MKAFTRVSGIAAVLMRPDIDTDQITPGHTGMKVQKSGFGAGLFHNWRYLPDGRPNPNFVLNQQPFNRAVFIVAGPNFGCGSSREFAVWALRDFGIRAIVAAGFGAIFTRNCYANGVLPITLEARQVTQIADDIAPSNCQLDVDLEQSTVRATSGRTYSFGVPTIERERFLEGLDAIDVTRKKRAGLIAEFQQRDTTKRPWVYKV